MRLQIQDDIVHKKDAATIENKLGDFSGFKKCPEP